MSMLEIEGSGNFLANPLQQEHFVVFYEDEAELSEAVASYLVSGLHAGRAVVAITTPGHRRLFLDRLAGLSYDTDGALASGQLTLLDARGLLATFMVNGMPARARFEAIVGGLLGSVEVRHHESGVCAYGEMVDLLVLDGQLEAALALEALWNELAERLSFSLCCSCSQRGLTGDSYARLCGLHTHAFPANSEHEAHAPARTRSSSHTQLRVLESEPRQRRNALRDPANDQRASAAATPPSADTALRLSGADDKPGDRPAEEADRSAQRLRLQGVCVLVVDDEPDARELVAAILERRGATVVMAASAAEARERLQEFRPRLVVSDIGMPGEDGYQFVRTLRARPAEEGGAVPTVALTAFTSPQDRRRAFDAGFNDHLAKPVHPETLVNTLCGLLG